MNTIGHIQWTCPTCHAVMNDGIDDELGPFITCCCDKCGKSYDQVTVGAQFIEATEEATR